MPKTLDELRKTPAHVVCEHRASQRSCDACECLALDHENAALKARVEVLECRIRSDDGAFTHSMEETRVVKARVEVLEAQLLDGMPSTANTKDPVPTDQKPYRVWARSHVAQWERGPNVWVSRDDDSHRWHDDAGSYAINCDGWLPEPDQSGEDDPT